ncbi:Regulatory protein CAT8 [Pichia kudriavzevii]|uniref:Regulatory protein CAT8 n=1 Tax=Pichia kudriavzevii TaxID=4909 RepID=A0A1V2LKP1_PICKU|nr:Regulatory protein CAT8 [Pichia kudriavzevii]
MQNQKTKTIKQPGSTTMRVSVACDRCRKKKIRCFYEGDDEQCVNCKNVGLDCIFTDKLARKAFPRGYTESLEERVRELEYENKKLQKLLTLKDVEDDERPSLQQKQQPQLLQPGDASLSLPSQMQPLSQAQTPMQAQVQLHQEQQAAVSLLREQTRSSKPLHGGGRGESPIAVHALNMENISKLQPFESEYHRHDENCNCGMHHSVINRPVSIAGSVDVDQGDLSDEDSLYSASNEHQWEGNESPIHTIDKIKEFKKQRQANNQYQRFVYNPNSFEQINAPGAAAAISLQNKLRTKNFLNLANLIAASIPRSTEETLFIPTLLARVIKTHGFDSKAPYLTARSIALLKQAYNEDERYKLFPINFQGINFKELNKEQSVQFFNNLNLPNNINLDICITIYFNTWNKTIPILNKEIFMKNYKKFIKSREVSYEDGEMIGFEKFGELLVIITCLLIQSNMSNICSISSLQIITIELLYCLNTDDLSMSYELRGRMITMCQQLRLHRCPSAVLGSNGSNVSRLQQGERRILFWCIYTLDSFSSFILGVPRLLKDYEIECALPASLKNERSGTGNDNEEGEGEDEEGINFITFKDNYRLSLVGKVCESALSVMRYSKVLGTIVDSVFKRSDGLKHSNINEGNCLIMEDLLESWKNGLREGINFKDVDIESMSEVQLMFYYLYYQAKSLIYMPLLANESGNMIEHGLRNSPSMISIQQATNNILSIFKEMNSQKHGYYYMPIPINMSRQSARYSLLAAKNALEYTRGGSLFQESKTLLGNVMKELKISTRIGLLGCLSENCVACLESAVDAILSQPRSKGRLRNGVVGEQFEEGIGEGEAISRKEQGVQQHALNDIFSNSSVEEPVGVSTSLPTNNTTNCVRGDATTNGIVNANASAHTRASPTGSLPGYGRDKKDDTGIDINSFNSNAFGVDASMGLPYLDLDGLDFDMDMDMDMDMEMNLNLDLGLDLGLELKGDNNEGFPVDLNNGRGR